MFGRADENLRAFLMEGPKAERQRLRMAEAIAVAKGLAGDAVMNYRLTEVDGRPVLLDKTTGEVLEAGPGQGRALRFAVMHLLGADPANHAVGVVRDVHEDGREEFHEEATAQTRHSSRLNTNYIEAMRRRNRKNARRAVRSCLKSLSAGEAFQHHRGLRGRMAWSLLTLTLPRVDGMTPFLEVKRINRAMDLFRKREAWKLRVRGAIKGVEMKLSVFMGQVGIHVHAHLLILSKWWRWQDLRAEWFAAVCKATEDVYGVELDDEALEGQVEGGVVTDIRTVRTKEHAGEVDLEDALQETLKYITKPDDWDALVKAGQVGRDLLLELEEIERWPRMFELLGKAREVKARPSDSAAAEGGRGFLDTACVNDGTAQAPEEDHPLDGSIPGLLPQESRPQGGPETGPLVSARPPPVTRPPSWRQLMDTLPIGEWVAVMVKRMVSARRYIGRLILETRGGIWFTLDGRPLGAGEPEQSAKPFHKAPRLTQCVCPMGDLWAGTGIASEPAMSRKRLDPKERASTEAIKHIRSMEGPVTLHMVAAAFMRTYKTAKRWMDAGVLQAVKVTRMTIFVNRQQVIELLDQMEVQEPDPVDQRTILQRLKIRKS